MCKVPIYAPNCLWPAFEQIEAGHLKCYIYNPKTLIGFILFHLIFTTYSFSE